MDGWQLIKKLVWPCDTCICYFLLRGWHTLYCKNNKKSLCSDNQNISIFNKWFSLTVCADFKKKRNIEY